MSFHAFLGNCDRPLSPSTPNHIHTNNVFLNMTVTETSGKEAVPNSYLGSFPLLPLVNNARLSINRLNWTSNNKRERKNSLFSSERSCRTAPPRMSLFFGKACDEKELYNDYILLEQFPGRKEHWRIRHTCIFDLWKARWYIGRLESWVIRFFGPRHLCQEGNSSRNTH